jgi:hypothetical protein
MLKEIMSFSKEFLDYYDLNDLTMTNSSNNFTNWEKVNLGFPDRNYTQHLIRIIDNSPGTETYIYKPYNLNIYKDRLVSFLQNFTTEFEVEKEPALITIYSHKQGSLVKTLYFDLKAFSNTSITEPIDYIELKLIQNNEN